MHLPRNKNLVAFARELRKNMTKEERHLWYDFLRYCSPRFRRQEIVGSYIADFYCEKARLVIELDGSQHTEPEAVAYDTVRTAFFNRTGFTWFAMPTRILIKILMVFANIFFCY